MTPRPIYLDHHATTPLDSAVLDAMMPYLTDKFGNASSRTHAYGWEAEEAVHQAREQVASLINARPEEIVFTSGATESDNLALKGIARGYRQAATARDRGNHVITTTTEHRAILDACEALEAEGFDVTYVPVDRGGLVDPEDVRRAITPRTILISVMYVNAEIGTIAPLAKIGAIARAHGLLFHSDAVQGVGKIACNVDDLGVDLMSISAHKIYGPKGIGALYVRKTHPERIRLHPMIDGGGQERGLRSGTANVPGIVGFGKACEVCQSQWETEAIRLRGPAAAAARRTDGTHRRRLPQWLRRAAAARQPERQLRPRAGRVAAAQHAARGGAVRRLGVLVGVERTVLRVAGHRRG